MRMRKVLLSFVLLAAAAACDTGPKSGYGLRLPEGEPDRGRQVFIDKHCTSCHEVIGQEPLREGVDPEMTVYIGGLTTKIDTYGQLVTSVVNPSHKIAKTYRRDEFSSNGESAMRSYNDEMTVTELIDLVAFLQEQYEEFPDDSYYY